MLQRTPDGNLDQRATGEGKPSLSTGVGGREEKVFNVLLSIFSVMVIGVNFVARSHWDGWSMGQLAGR